MISRMVYHNVAMFLPGVHFRVLLEWPCCLGCFRIPVKSTRVGGSVVFALEFSYQRSWTWRCLVLLLAPCTTHHRSRLVYYFSYQVDRRGFLQRNQFQLGHSPPFCCWPLFIRYYIIIVSCNIIILYWIISIIFFLVVELVLVLITVVPVWN